MWECSHSSVYCTGIVGLVVVSRLRFRHSLPLTFLHTSLYTPAPLRSHASRQVPRAERQLPQPINTALSAAATNERAGHGGRRGAGRADRCGVSVPRVGDGGMGEGRWVGGWCTGMAGTSPRNCCHEVPGNTCR